MDPDKQSGICFLLERQFRQVAFFYRVPLEDLAIVHREAGQCRTKAEFLRPHVEHLRSLVLLSLGSCPADLGWLADEFPEVGRLLAKRVD